MTLWSGCVHSVLTLVFHSVRSVLFDLGHNRLMTFFELNYQYGNLCAKLLPLLDLFYDSETGRTWYHTCEQNIC